MVLRFEIDPTIAPLADISAVLLEGLGGDASALDPAIASEVQALRERHAGRSAGSIPHLAAARKLYKALGIDPTRHRPSPEALLRRLLRGDPFPRHAPAVDLANLWAVLHGHPVGLYDAARLDGDWIVARRGRPGESYPGIGRPEINLEGRLVLEDGSGPFGNPTADSLRTCVDGSTAAALAVLFTPRGHDPADIRATLAWLEEKSSALLGARPTRLREAEGPTRGS